MTGSAHDYLTLVRRVNAALSEALASAGEGGKGGSAYCRQLLITALDDLAGLSRKYAFAPEARNPHPFAGAPVISDNALRNELAGVSERLKRAADAMGVGAVRIAEAVEQWVESKDPSRASLIGVHAKTVARTLRHGLSSK